MSENVKIIINEKDNTTPTSAATDSTDIAFIPGFSTVVTAPVNEPILFTDVDTFMDTFGTEPIKLTSQDLHQSLEKKNYSHLNFVSGDYDRSYVYAKELLRQGLPVVYANLGDTFNSLVSVTKYSSEGEDERFTLESADNSIRVKAIQAYKGDVVVNCSVLPELIGTVRYGLIPKITSGAAYVSDVSYVKVTSESDFATEVCGDYLYVTNPTATSETVDIEVSFTFTVDMSLGDYFTFDVYTSTGSLLEAIYTEDSIGNNLETCLDLISDKSVYSVKYITSGGYPTVTKKGKDINSKIAQKLIKAAKTRGDAVALLDYQLDDTLKVFDTTAGFYADMQTIFAGAPDTEYAAAMYPWAKYNCFNTFENPVDVTMPGSFGYLMCVAKAIKSSPNWLAMAGVTRGQVPNIKSLCAPRGVVSNTDAENMQPKFGSANNTVSVNCITNIRPYGLTLWGNRTLKPLEMKKSTTALNFLNTRNMVSDIKKVLYTTAKSLMFEQNTDTLWLRFKDGISPLLNQLKMGNGISDFQIIKATKKHDGSKLTRGELAAVIRIYPISAVEYFDLSVEINDQDVAVS